MWDIPNKVKEFLRINSQVNPNQACKLQKVSLYLCKIELFNISFNYIIKEILCLVSQAQTIR
jgi:hypothetical protein